MDNSYSSALSGVAIENISALMWEEGFVKMVRESFPELQSLMNTNTERRRSTRIPLDNKNSRILRQSITNYQGQSASIQDGIVTLEQMVEQLKSYSNGISTSLPVEDDDMHEIERHMKTIGCTACRVRSMLRHMEPRSNSITSSECSQSTIEKRGSYYNSRYTQYHTLAITVHSALSSYKEIIDSYYTKLVSNSHHRPMSYWVLAEDDIDRAETPLLDTDLINSVAKVKQRLSVQEHEITEREKRIREWHKLVSSTFQSKLESDDDCSSNSSPPSYDIEAGLVKVHEYTTDDSQQKEDNKRQPFSLKRLGLAFLLTIAIVTILLTAVGIIMFYYGGFTAVDSHNSTIVDTINKSTFVVTTPSTTTHVIQAVVTKASVRYNPSKSARTTSEVVQPTTTPSIPTSQYVTDVPVPLVSATTQPTETKATITMQTILPLPRPPHTTEITDKQKVTANVNTTTINITSVVTTEEQKGAVSTPTKLLNTTIINNSSQWITTKKLITATSETNNTIATHTIFPTSPATENDTATIANDTTNQQLVTTKPSANATTLTLNVRTNSSNIASTISTVSNTTNNNDNVSVNTASTNTVSSIQTTTAPLHANATDVLSANFSSENETAEFTGWDNSTNKLEHRNNITDTSNQSFTNDIPANQLEDPADTTNSNVQLQHTSNSTRVSTSISSTLSTRLLEGLNVSSQNQTATKFQQSTQLLQKTTTPALDMSSTTANITTLELNITASELNITTTMPDKTTSSPNSIPTQRPEVANTQPEVEGNKTGTTAMETTTMKDKYLTTGIQSSNSTLHVHQIVATNNSAVLVASRKDTETAPPAR